MDFDTIQNIKKCCVGIGLREIDTGKLISVNGSGFFIDPNGFLITADHVIDIIKKLMNDLEKERSIKTERVAIFLGNQNAKNSTLLMDKITESRSLIVKCKDIEDYLPENSDINICRIHGKFGNLPTLKLKKPTILNVYDQILMCGYPGGDSSLNVFDMKFGFRISPVIQNGRISSLMPSDYTTQPVCIITDVIGTGGSSGSPIISANDQEVISIGQRVIPGPAFDFNKNPIGGVTTGLVWGTSLYFHYDAIFQMIKMMKQNEDEFGDPLDTSSDVLHSSFTVGEGSFPKDSYAP